MATPQDLLSALASAYSLTDSKFGGDPGHVEAIERVREIQGGIGWLVVSIQPEGLVVSGNVIPDLNGDFHQFQAALEEAGIQEIRFQEVLGFGVLEEFLRRLHPSSATEGILPSARFRGLEGDVGLSFRDPQADLPGMAGAVQKLFQTSTPALPASTDGAEELDSGSVGPDALFPPPRRVLSPEVVEEVKVYLDSYDLLRAESEKRLRDTAERLTKSRDVAALGELVQLLVESADSKAGDPEAVGLAQELTTPAAASNIVARLGAAGDETERGRLTRVLFQIGQEGVLALADALGESRDRSERRAFLAAMVTLGPLALETAQRMVADPRWFVVRNGVSVLGELGGEGVLTHLTGTLANRDSRVRTETILSLAKVGGEDAEILLLGMLDDGEAEVRATASKALGALKSPRAYRPLLELLKDDAQEVQVETLQALGQIGDPGAVPLIEKKAMGGLVSRPPREVRIAALRALVSIGTTRALKTVEKGTKDRDSIFRAVAAALLEER